MFRTGRPKARQSGIGPASKTARGETMTVDPISALEAQLHDAAQARIGGTHAATTPPTSHRRVRAAIGITLVAGAVLAGGATAAYRLIGDSDRDIPPRAERPQAQTPSPRMERNLSIIDRPREPDDALPPRGRSLLSKDANEPDYDGANPALSRRARVAVDGVGFWVVPGNDTVCIVASTGSAAAGGCAPTRIVLQGTFARSSGGTGFGLDPGEMVHYGIVPDGIERVTLETTEGDKSLPVQDNVWAVTAKFGSLDAVRFASVRIPISDPGPPPGAGDAAPSP
jgi:hypothetical protein